MVSDIDRSLVISYLFSCTRLFDAVPQLEKHLDAERTGVYSLIKGAVQSGKSSIIFSLVLYLRLVLGHRVAIVLRNYLDDYEQFERGFCLFHQDFIDWCEGHVMEDVYLDYAGHVESDSPTVMVGLYNKSQIARMVHHMSGSEGSYSLIIDEVDQLMYSDGQVVKNMFDILLDSSAHIIGVSATLYDSLQDNRFEIGQTFLLLPPANYKGIQDVHYEAIDPLNSVDGPMLQRDQSLYRFLCDHSMHPGYGDKPFLCLVKIERLIAEQERLMQEMVQCNVTGSAYTIIVYNGREVRIYSRLMLNLPTKVGDANIYVCRRTSIQSVLQYLKDNGGVEKFPRIVIIAHNLVGRGINIVSLDFKWHLTHMFFRPSLTATIPSIIQSMRLCGIFDDSIDLTCYMTEEDRQELYKGFLLQEEIFDRIRKTNSIKETTDVFLSKQRFHRHDIPTKPIGKSGRFRAVIVEDDSDALDTQRYKRLCRWINQDSLIGRMIRHLYMHTEPIKIHRLHRECGYTGTKKSFQSAIDNGCSHRSNFGKMWIQHHKRVVLNPDVRQFMRTYYKGRNSG